MNELLEQINTGNCLGIVRSADGRTACFNRKGVIDLFTLVSDDPDFGRNGIMADKVIGKGAALLIIKAGISRLHAQLISQPALLLLTDRGVKTTYDTLVPHIINRTGSDICPVEKLTAHINNPDQAFIVIKDFLANIINKK